MEAGNTFSFENYSQTIRQENAGFSERDPECQQVISELRKIETFLERLGTLTFGRDFVIVTHDNNSSFFSLSSVMISLELTMGSLIACCENVCMADANTLLRKYRDDLFFYLYVSAWNSLDKISNEAKSMEAQISRWLKNDLADFRIGQVLQAIASVPQLRDAILKYKLKESFQKISDYLNNYVHGNGYAYYNRAANAYREGELVVELKKLWYNARYMTMTFLLLLVFCSPVSVMSEAYIDYLDCNATPPEGSQYWVASFIEDFVKENISLIDKNCLDYLRENTMMQF